ncbi:MAG TPA: ribonuclease P protein component [Bacillota bacterium]|nr:ribonuclease P protein component [Bacillota bacterium]HPT86338.1 ribonuclease P protein component [Bacillota bacterium]
MSKFEFIKKNSDFQTVFEKGHSILSRYLVVYFLPKPQEKTRFGICVGKKLGKAVTRNRLKRILREAIQRLEPDQIPEGDLVLVGRQRLIDASLMEITVQLQMILAKLRNESQSTKGKTEDSQ